MVLATDLARADQVLPYSLEDEVARATAGRHAEFRALVREVAFGYADQVAADWESFVKGLAES